MRYRLDAGAAVGLELLEEVHSTLLKSVTDTPDEMELRFATGAMAVVTVPSTMKGTFTAPTARRTRTTEAARRFCL